ncbi:hypothetical protein BT93_H1073 [Corymbia citriodora subsp. variegata]|nr:hypothetical protein BT93_H1073 [Corymbia citriodora subsp. variegata]
MGNATFLKRFHEPLRQTQPGESKLNPPVPSFLKASSLSTEFGVAMAEVTKLLRLRLRSHLFAHPLSKGPKGLRTWHSLDEQSKELKWGFSEKDKETTGLAEAAETTAVGAGFLDVSRDWPWQTKDVVRDRQAIEDGTRKRSTARTSEWNSTP